MLERMLGARGLPLVKMNPRHTRAFARAAECMSKTDRIDAAVLARFRAGCPVSANFPGRSAPRKRRSAGASQILCDLTLSTQQRVGLSRKA
ncbi:IS110 family transposase [Mesorhizobium sp. B2-4-19]|nr:IS110 family transposase [Mesorhizobium sp. B2-4-19]